MGHGRTAAEVREELSRARREMEAAYTPSGLDATNHQQRSWLGRRAAELERELGALEIAEVARRLAGGAATRPVGHSGFRPGSTSDEVATLARKLADAETELERWRAFGREAERRMGKSWMVRRWDAVELGLRLDGAEKRKSEDRDTSAPAPPGSPAGVELARYRGLVRTTRSLAADMTTRRAWDRIDKILADAEAKLAKDEEADGGQE